MKYLLPLFVFISVAVQAQVLNAYAKISTISMSKTTLTITNVNQASHTFTVGGEVVVMQMQDDVIGTNTTNIAAFGNLGSIASAGQYEVRTISARSPATGTPTTITLSSALANSYNTGANSAVQLISFRDLGANYTTTATISGLTWDGSLGVGGVIAIQVTNTLTLNNSISANAIGFAGGTRNANFYSACDDATYVAALSSRYSGKAEGIYKNTTAGFTGARGKILNGGGGGNDVNGGGGGGGNFSAGGAGGSGWVPAGTGCSPFVGGLGGLNLSGQVSAARIFMGGGGGAGHQNDSNGSDGGKGGGIILVKATNIRTSGACAVSITANGATASNGTNDGAGGGGAAGTIVLQVNTYSITGTCPLTVASNGGGGGSSVTTGNHGGGGGGGQGVVIYSIAQPTANVTTSTAVGTGGTSCVGCTVGNGSPGPGGNNLGIINASGPLPIELISFEAKPSTGIVELFWKTATEINNDFYTVEKSIDAIEFTVVGTMKANNTTTTSKYQLSDTKPYNGTSYYRLKQTDFNQTYTYSAIVAVEFNSDIKFSVFPNPLLLNQSLLIAFDKAYGERVDLNIYDVTGKSVFVQTINISNQQEVKIDNLNLAAGIYSVRLSSEYLNLTQKLIVD
ncbi:MAG: T9SS type A sorting domain-containing protein [Bacteroidota bacterium]